MITRYVGLGALAFVIGVAFVATFRDSTPTVVAQDIEGTVAVPQVCYTPRESYPPLPTVQPAAREKWLADLKRVAPQRARLYIEPSQEIYHPIITAVLEGIAAPPMVPIERSSIRFALTSSGRDYSAYVRLTTHVPEPLNPRNPCDHTPVFSAGAAIDVRGLPAGMYELGVSAKSKALTLPEIGSFIPVPTLDWSYRLYIPAQPRQLPSMRSGQRFLVFPGKSATYADAAGHPVARRDVAMRIAILERHESNRFIFRVEGTVGEIAISSDRPFTQLPGLLPLVDDDVVSEVNRQYAGRQVWGRGANEADCFGESPGGIFSGSGPNKVPLTIVRIFRVYHSAYELAIGGQMGASGGSRESGFVDESPLIVWLRVPNDTLYERFGPQGCAAWFLVFADAWDLSREFTLLPVRQAHPEWPAETLVAIENGKVENGMSHEQVAWAIGYPAIYGKPSELDRLSAWRYDHLTPFSYWVYFDKRGRVRKSGNDGNLP